MDETNFNAKYNQNPNAVEDVESQITAKRAESQSDSVENQPEVGFTINVSGINGESQLSEAEKYEQSEAAWVQPGKEVTINGFTIPGGMIYVGTELDSVEDFVGTDAALIDPSLDIDPTELDPDGERMSYWPSYSSIDSGCRATYLKWLESGRRDPDIDIGYVFLFFYSLERRVFFDADHSDEARAEIPDLLNEVEGLLEVYGGDGSFESYASGFLEAARARFDFESLISTIPSQDERYRSLPVGIKVKIGRMIANGESIDAETAYEWFQYSPDIYPRTPANRCENEFKELFFARFDERFDGGLHVEPIKTTLSISYRTASRSIPAQDGIEIEDIPDISTLSKPQEDLQDLVYDCCDELDSYSRYVGKHQDWDSLQALALLPEPILEQRENKDLEKFVQVIETELDSTNIADTELDVLLKHWPVDPNDDVRKRDLRRLARLLEKLGYGIEPDVRFSAPSRGWGDPAVLFRLPPNEGIDESEISEGIRLIQKLAVKIVLSNDEVAPEQTEYLAENLGNFLDLSDADRGRLEAHRRWLIHDSPTLHGVRRRLEDISADRKANIAEFLTALACSDGEIDPEEIEELSKLYPMLGLDEKLVHTHLHQLQTPQTSPEDPVTIYEPDSASEEYEIPEPDTSDDPPISGIELDEERVARTLNESQEVSEFLAEIFEDGEDTPPESPEPKPAPNTEETTSDSDLDEGYRTFLTKLSQQSQWEREEVEALAREEGLFTDAAIEVINDHAFERLETPIIEGTDEIVINQELASELLE